MYIYVHAYIHTYLFTYIHTYIQICIYSLTKDLPTFTGCTDGSCARRGRHRCQADGRGGADGGEPAQRGGGERARRGQQQVSAAGPRAHAARVVGGAHG